MFSSTGSGSSSLAEAAELFSAELLSPLLAVSPLPLQAVMLTPITPTNSIARIALKLAFFITKPPKNFVFMCFATIILANFP